MVYIYRIVSRERGVVTPRVHARGRYSPLIVSREHAHSNHASQRGRSSYSSYHKFLNIIHCVTPLPL